MDIVFFGSGEFALPALEALAGSGHRIVQVISQPDRPAGRGKQLAATAVSGWALEHGVPLLRTENANGSEGLALLRSLAPDAAVVIALGQKLSEELLLIPRHRAINLHSSLLPKYRGAAPIHWAMINDDAEAGVSVIEVTPRMDAGDILASAATPIGAEETAGELHDRLARLGAGLVPAVLDAVAGGKLQRAAQDESQATRAPKLSKEMAWVDFQASARAVSARIRGLSPWPGVRVELLDAGSESRVIATVLKCRAVRGEGAEKVHPAEICGRVQDDLSVACGSGAIELLSLHPQNKKPMPLEAFAHGYGFGAGARVRSVVAAPRVHETGVTGTK